MNLKGNPNIEKAGASTRYSSGCRAAVENGRAGGKQRAENEKQKKLLRESIMEAADMVATLTDDERQAIIEKGCDPNDVTNRARFVAALWFMAGQPSKDGNSDRRLLMDASGEMTNKMEVQLSPFEYLAKVRELRENEQ